MSAEVALDLLAVAVPMWMRQARDMTPEARMARAQVLSQFIAEHGDDILYRGKHTRDGFNALAEGLALAAFVPGGITFHGMHFEA